MASAPLREWLLSFDREGACESCRVGQFLQAVDLASLAACSRHCHAALVSAAVVRRFSLSALPAPRGNGDNAEVRTLSTM